MNAHLIRNLLVLAGLLAGSAAHAAAPAFEGYAAASDTELDAMRGGFEFNFNGMQLMFSFSLERLTYINGELVSSMKLNPLELIAPPSAPAMSEMAQTGTLPASPVPAGVVNNPAVISLIQNGAGNAFTLPASLNSLATVIQNTVDDQVIRNLTVLNATLSIQAAAAAMRLDAALNQAIAAGIR